MARRRLVVAALAVTACGRRHFDEIGGPNDDAAVSDASMTAPRCAIPPRPDLAGATPITTCNETTIRAAVTAGGTVVLSCPGTTVALTSAITVAQNVVLSAPGVTFDGRGVTRNFVVDQAAAFTLLDATLVGGVTTVSGAAIYVNAGSLTIDGALFMGNVGPASHPFEGGGAIGTASSGTTLAVYRSRFVDNASANGGAIQSLGDTTIASSSFEMNAATGTGGSGAQGGLGGALNINGTNQLTLCDVVLSGNRAGAIGGAIHRVITTGTRETRLDKVRITGNTSTGDAGAAYLQNTNLTLHQVSIDGNLANQVGGVWFQNDVSGSLVAENVTIANNRTMTGVGAGIHLAGGPGSISFSTIANNNAACPSCISSAIDRGENVKVMSSIIVDNAAGTSPVSCAQVVMDGGGNYQWPPESPLCAAGATAVDPVLDPSAEQSGPAGTFWVRRPVATSPIVGVAQGCPAEDLLGNPRPSPCSAGAVEP